MPLYLPDDRQPAHTPEDHGIKAWSIDPAAVQGGTLLTAGTVKLDRINIRRKMSVTTAYIWTSVAGSSLTADQNFIGLYSSAGTRLVTVDVDTDFAAAAGLQTIALGSTVDLDAGFVYFAWLTNGGTAPTVARATGVTGGTNPLNVGQAVGVSRSAMNATSQTSLPSSLTLANNVKNFAVMWCALS